MIDAPIRGMSNQVTLHTANAVKEFFDLCQTADPESGYLALPPWQQQKVVSINQQMGLVAGSQQELIKLLDDISDEHLTRPGFDKVMGDLERVVSQVDSAISDTYSAPEPVVRLWKANLELVAQQNGHIDSYVESFRIALDENCSALLANLATNILEERTSA